jgi:hypothetical protein
MTASWRVAPAAITPASMPIPFLQGRANSFATATTPKLSAVTASKRAANSAAPQL